jgi:hypothetical protein
VVSDQPPGARSQPLPPTLEDAYLHRMSAARGVVGA